MDLGRRTTSSWPARRMARMPGAIWLDLGMLAATLAVSMIKPCQADPATDAILDAIVARGTAIFSAKIEFEVASIIRRDGRDIPEASQKRTLSVSGDNWILRYHESPNFIMNYNDSTVHYYQTESDKTGIYRSLQMTAPTPIDQVLGSDYAFSVARNGTLWYRPQLRFVDQERTRVEQQNGEVIDGHPTVLLQWRVDINDLDDAFVVVPHKIGEDLAGILHLYAAPTLGYALPRIDYLTLAGQLVRRYESSDFIEIDGGLFFPMSTQCIAFSDDEDHVTRFTISSIQHVNQDLPREEFALQIPSGTRVHDSRPGRPQAVFHLGNQKGIEEVAQMVDQTAAKADRFSLRMGCLIANGLLVLFLFIVWIRRQCRSSL